MNRLRLALGLSVPQGNARRDERAQIKTLRAARRARLAALRRTNPEAWRNEP